MPIGWQELLIILVIVVIIFGAGKLPEIGGALGKGIREFREQSGEDENDDKLGTPTDANRDAVTAQTTRSDEQPAVNTRREVRAEEI